VSRHYNNRISRREALVWLSAMSSSVSIAGCVYPGAPTETESPDGLEWPELDLPPVKGPGYGKDPILIAPQDAPWPRTLSTDQLNLVASLCDVICPGAFDAGVPDVIDEWLSAPYPQQQNHRRLIMPGLIWLEQWCDARLGASFTVLRVEQQIQIIEDLDIPEEGAPTSMQLPVRFFWLLRELVAGAYFTSPQGVSELGYEGNVPLVGDYPGPSADAMAHLDGLLQELGLEL